MTTKYLARTGTKAVALRRVSNLTFRNIDNDDWSSGSFQKFWDEWYDAMGQGIDWEFIELYEPGIFHFTKILNTDVYHNETFIWPLPTKIKKKMMKHKLEQFVFFPLNANPDWYGFLISSRDLFVYRDYSQQYEKLLSDEESFYYE